ncbi:uncharacterized protein FOBCDRAFT_254558 [Fusarium oxysporum Fo47]|uniref:uncharacterized protein n=1 Tax=Fusarium oxysporum Fo47 TaxID=660027 RepID=UPI002869999F|nr:uncharacterized protein FOBCDRAFT_254558 [Fusarium oxysporum Fo47]QKD62662.2 hypothetical protein FOBCDRAFT_254558 [Fusarium oxysporum Fo47]
MVNNQQQSAVAQKANCTDLHNQQDLRVLPFFQRLHRLSCRGATAPAILGVRCSYGINGALLRHQVDLETWTAHYTGSGPDSKQQALADKEFFASRERSPKPVVLGLDKADHAVRYALDAGLIDAGWIEGLEVKDPSPDLRKALQGVSLIIYAGGVIGRSSNLWVASTVIGTPSYEEIATELTEHGLVTERLPGVVLPNLIADLGGVQLTDADGVA